MGWRAGWRRRVRHNPRVLIVFLDYDHATPVGLMLCGAAKLLGPHLPIKSIANAEPASYRDKIDLKIDYDAANDTLWMSNSRPADVAYPIIDDAVIVYFEAGSENITEEDCKIPSGVMVYDAVKRIEPAILTDLAELAAAKGGA